LVPVRGRPPKAFGVSNNRHRPVHDWVEVADVPFEVGMELPEFRADGRSWPERTKAKWEAWRSMPHAKLWYPAEWSFALDTLELAADFHKTGEPRFGTELRNREKVLGTTLDYLRGLRIRYVEPCADTPADVANMSDYRDL
jgi:hypothetical protein